MPKMTWADVEKRRQELPKLSRAELARRAGVSESTYAKGLNDKKGPRTLRKGVREQVELVLDAAEDLIKTLHNSEDPKRCPTLRVSIDDALQTVLWRWSLEGGWRDAKTGEPV